MEFILVFLAGMAAGAAIVYFIQKFVAKKSTDAYSDIYEKMQMQFENLSNKIFKETTQDFSTMSKERMTEILEPFKEKFDELKKQSVINNEHFAKLDVHIKDVLETGSKISADTNTLASALKGDNMVQGKWGELILERVLEVSGLRKGEEYVTQTAFSTGRPDATILLPDNKAVFIDAKTTLASYDAYLNAKDEDEAKRCLDMFKMSVKTHITNLARKEYFNAEEVCTPEYVLMFIPIESCYMLLFSGDSELWEFAWKNKIMPVSPSTLLAALKIINNFNVVNRQNKNAQEIAALAGKMLDKFSGLLNDMNGVQKSLSNAMTKLTGRDNVIRQAQRMQELGAKASKQLPELNIKEECPIE